MCCIYIPRRIYSTLQLCYPHVSLKWMRRLSRATRLNKCSWVLQQMLQDRKTWYPEGGHDVHIQIWHGCSTWELAIAQKITTSYSNMMPDDRKKRAQQQSRARQKRYRQDGNDGGPPDKQRHLTGIHHTYCAPVWLIQSVYWKEIMVCVVIVNNHFVIKLIYYSFQENSNPCQVTSLKNSILC